LDTQPDKKTLETINMNIYVYVKKLAILNAIEPTNNGKTATIEQQSTILQLVRTLETLAPPPTDLFLSQQSLSQLNGTWFLQYTSPSQIGKDEGTSNDDSVEEDNNNENWEPIYANEGESNIETKRFQAKGSISAGGIQVDTSNKPVLQIINVDQKTVMNDVEFDWGHIIAGGSFKQSNVVPNRAVVAFDTASIRFGSTPEQQQLFRIELGFIFEIISKVRNSRDNGWLETTYLDSNMRIGRGNKGTMFVLTKDPNIFTS
jgi:PAP_fibrillin